MIVRNVSVRGSVMIKLILLTVIAIYPAKGPMSSPYAVYDTMEQCQAQGEVFLYAKPEHVLASDYHCLEFDMPEPKTEKERWEERISPPEQKE